MGPAQRTRGEARPMLKVIAVAAVSALAVCAQAGGAGAEDSGWMHATGLIDKPKYPPDFKRFDYVNPDAPKGGLVRMSDTGTFDSLNLVPAKGATPLGLGLIYDSLMTDSLDEVSTEYGLLADKLKYPADYSSVTYHLRDNARWQDGQPITPDDVVWSFQIFTDKERGNPGQAFYYKHVVKAEKTGDHEVTFTFDEAGNRELPHIVGQLNVLPKHYWEGTDAQGNKRDIFKSTLEPPLGSGPYKIKSVVPGRSISYERVPDYWGKDLPVNIGANNFGEIRYEYFRDDTVELQAFKADQIDWRAEASARVWATEYEFPAVQQKRVLKELFEQPYKSTGLMVGFTFNLNRDTFKDVRVRQAFDLAMPFEEMNKTLFFGQYTRFKSYFDGIPLASSGLPQGRELEILNEVKDAVPPEVFTQEYANPLNDSSQRQRDNLRQALKLLNDAGWQLQGNQMVNAKTGKPLTAEYLIYTPTFEKVGLSYQNALKRIGINLQIREVDSAQYENRVRSRDYDIIYVSWAETMSPGNEQIDFFGSSSADREGSHNYGAIRNPAVDKIIQHILYTKDRAELVAATKALDRVLLWNHYVVPGWGLKAERVARWDRFSHPEPLPTYSHGFPTIWWADADKAKKIGGSQ
jgi:microcin C transport system substrate-binding protein